MTDIIENPQEKTKPPDSSKDRLQQQYVGTLGSPQDRPHPPVPGKGTPVAGENPNDIVIEAQKPPLPSVTKKPDGSIKIGNEAEIKRSADGKVILSRPDKTQGGFELSRTEEGGITYTHKGDRDIDNFTCTINPDGKGGNNIKWQDKSGKEKINYNWTPKTETNAKKITGQQNIEKIKNTLNLMDDTEGLRLSLDKNFGHGDFSPNVIFTDKQGNEITIQEFGHLQITDKKDEHMYSFKNQSDGYTMSSIGATEDNIVRKSVRKRSDYTSYADGTSVLNKADGSFIKSKKLPDGITQRDFSDGRMQLRKRAADGGIDSWTFFPEYPGNENGKHEKDSFLYEHTVHGETHSRDSTKMRLEAEKLQKFLSKQYNVSFSSDKDKPIRSEENAEKEYAVRSPTLRELQVLEKVLEKIPVDKTKTLHLNFLDRKNLDDLPSVGATYLKDNIAFNPIAHKDEWLQGDTAITEDHNTLESMGLHEFGHLSTERLDPKGWKDGSLEKKLGARYGMHVHEDPTFGKEWYVEGEEMVNGEKKTFYYRAVPDFSGTTGGDAWQRLNAQGIPVHPSGEPIKEDDFPEIIENISNYAKVKLSTDYSYVNPIETHAELLTTYRMNERSRATLLSTNKEIYDLIQADDQAEIAHYMPADAAHPQGWMRIPNGKIVPKTDGNQKLVTDFMAKYANIKKK